MAGTFGANTGMASDMSGELAEIRSAMTSMGQVFVSYGGSSGSSRIEDALENFFSESSDMRETMDGLLEGASGLLRGLAEGAGSVDTALNDSLTSATRDDRR